MLGTGGRSDNGLIDLGAERASEVLRTGRNCYLNLFHHFQKSMVKIKAVACDMSAEYHTVFLKCLPNGEDGL